MKILAITSELPYPPTYGGARLRQFELLKRLNEPHDVHLVTFWETDEDQELNKDLNQYLTTVSGVMKPSPRPVSSIEDRFQAKYWRLTWSEEMRQLIQKQVESLSPDVVYVSPAHMAFYRGTFGDIPCWLDLTDSGVLHTQADLKLASGLKAKLRQRLKLSAIQKFENQWISKYQACSLVAEPDANQLTKQLPQMPIHVIENGVDTEYFKPLENIKPECRVVFTGTMDFGPNIDAVTWFCTEIFPTLKEQLPEIQFDIVGRVPTQEVQELGNIAGVNVHGYIEDLREVVQRASVYVCPMRTGAGMKNKILEAMAMGMPIVTTRAGAAGLKITPGKEMYIQDQADSFASTVLNILKHHSRHNTMREEGRNYVLKNHLWQNSARKLSTKLQDLIE